MKVPVPPHLVTKDTKVKHKMKSGLKRKRTDPQGSYREAFAAGLSTQLGKRIVHWEDRPIATNGWNVDTIATMKENNGKPKKPTGPGSRTPSVMGSLM